MERNHNLTYSQCIFRFSHWINFEERKWPWISCGRPWCRGTPLLRVAFNPLQGKPVCFTCAKSLRDSTMIESKGHKITRLQFICNSIGVQFHLICFRNKLQSFLQFESVFAVEKYKPDFSAVSLLPSKPTCHDNYTCWQVTLKITLKGLILFWQVREKHHFGPSCQVWLQVKTACEKSQMFIYPSQP